MTDRVKVWQTDLGLRVEQIIDGQVRVRVCIWRELKDDIPVWHGFRGDFSGKPLRDHKGQLPPPGRGGDIMDGLEDFREHTADSMAEFLVWAVPE